MSAPGSVSCVRQEDVLGLQVAVNDPPRMSGRESVRDLGAQLRRLPPGHLRSEEARPEALSPEKLGDRVCNPALPSEIENRQDVGVGERRESLRLPLETRKCRRVFCQTLRKDLDRDFPIQPRIERPVDLTHPAGAERRQNLIGPEPGAGL
jgi:hypothetical protein